MRKLPIVCDTCKSVNIQFKTMMRSNRHWPYVWHCDDCGAEVGCHPGTNQPTGYMAPVFIRQLRAELHGLIDHLWKGYSKISRDSVYEWLADKLGVPSIQIGEMDIHQLKTCIELARAIDTSEMKQNPVPTRKPTAGFLRRDKGHRRRGGKSKYDGFE